ncbi:MAG TPA: hypothetical protein VLJ86_09985 [Ramlibacter sp.]|nr:hypothetical protein [Ramlibacter sp.]
MNHTPDSTLSPKPARRACLRALFTAAIASSALISLTAAAQAPGAGATPSPTVRLRGTIESVTAQKLVLRERGGERVELELPANLVVSEVYPIALADVQAGSYIGVGAMPQADGTQRAIAVTVFPEASRGAGEGHRPFDFMPQSTMTNATVAGVASAPDGRRLRLTYKNGEKTIVVPPDAPVVSFRPGTRELLTPGAAVSLSAQEIAGHPTALRINAGRSGFSPPY